MSESTDPRVAPPEAKGPDRRLSMSPDAPPAGTGELPRTGQVYEGTQCTYEQAETVNRTERGARLLVRGFWNASTRFAASGFASHIAERGEMQLSGPHYWCLLLVPSCCVFPVYLRWAVVQVCKRTVILGCEIGTMCWILVWSGEGNAARPG